ncbi:MAG: peptidoglycan DD-metalloendopeptidase family protein [Candidatus Margulisiibacteriota bacterium]
MIPPIAKNLIKLPSAERWSSEMISHQPVDTAKLPRFKCWLNAYGFDPRYHRGFDIFAYKGAEGVVLGLPNGTRVFSVADGLIIEVKDTELSYFAEIGIAIAVNKEAGSLLSCVYKHARPSPDIRLLSAVKGGELIGSLSDADDGYVDGKYHLHLEFRETRFKMTEDGFLVFDDEGRSFDPEPLLFPGQSLEKKDTRSWRPPVMDAYNLIKYW